jgi:uncharacterized Zn-finger protein
MNVGSFFFGGVAQTVTVARRGPPGVQALFKGRVRSQGDHVLYFCGVCGYTTAYSGSANRHYARHTGVKSSSCPYCCYATYRKDHLKVHIETHDVNGCG